MLHLQIFTVRPFYSQLTFPTRQLAEYLIPEYTVDELPCEDVKEHEDELPDARAPEVRQHQEGQEGRVPEYVIM